MWRKFCGWLLRTLGWTAVDPVAPEDKCIILGVPHTSIWDFVISYLYYVSVGGKPYCMIKGELFWGPLGWLLRKMGGIPVDRMGYFDWGTKRISRGHKVELTDDAKADMARIQALYEEMHLTGKHPRMYITK